MSPKDEWLAEQFKALAHPRRVIIFRLLAAHARDGIGFQAIQAATGLHDSSLVHHLREMERCGLIARRRCGVFAVYRLTQSEFVKAASTASQIVNANPVQKVA